jgi:hypothetical protein
MTEEQKENYLKDPDQCPYCGSLDITAEEADFETTSCTREVRCNEEDCGKKWVDIYEIKDVQEL